LVQKSYSLGVRRYIALGIVVWLAVVSLGCERSGPASIKAGDPSYPNLNATPHKLIRIFLTGANPNQIDVLLGYDTTAFLRGCYTRNGLAETSSLTVDLHSDFKKRPNGIYSADVYADHFSPGRCRWQLEVISLSIPTGKFRPTAALVGFRGPHEFQNASAPILNAYTFTWHCPRIGRSFCTTADTDTSLPTGWPASNYGEFHLNIIS